LGARLRDERGERGVVEVAAEPERDEQREADLLVAGRLGQPGRKRAPARGRDRERAPVAGTGRSRLHELALLERGELPVDVALRHVPEAGEAGFRLLEQLPPGLRAVVEHPEERALRRVQLGAKLDIPLGKVDHVRMIEQLQRDGYVLIEDAIDSATVARA